MQEPGRLARALIDRHAALEIIVALLQELDADMIDHRALAAVAHEVEVDIAVPDGHPRNPLPD